MLSMRVIAAILIVCLVSGCASTRQVRFSSEPAGATVKVGESSCMTPCGLNLPYKVQIAEISLPTGEKKEVRLDARPNRVRQAGYAVSRSGAITLEILSIPFLVVGIFGLALLSGNETDSFNNRDYEFDRNGFYVTMGALFAGGVLAYAGYSLEKASSALEPEEPDVRVVFPRSEEKPSQGVRSSVTLDEFTRWGGKPFLPHSSARKEHAGLDP